MEFLGSHRTAGSNYRRLSLITAAVVAALTTLAVLRRRSSRRSGATIATRGAGGGGSGEPQPRARRSHKAAPRWASAVSIGVALAALSLGARLSMALAPVGSGQESATVIADTGTSPASGAEPFSDPAQSVTALLEVAHGIRRGAT